MATLSVRYARGYRNYLLLALVCGLVACAEKKPAKTSVREFIPKPCITKVEPVSGKPCVDEKDGIHALCLFRVTYSCVDFK